MTRWRAALRTTSFAERLGSFLEELRAEVAARAVVLVQADARARVLRHRVQHAAPADAAVPGADLDDALAAELAALAARGETLTGREELAPLGSTFRNAEGARVIALAVSPRLCSDDSLLVLEGGEAPPAEAVQALTEALSEERLRGLERAALAAFDSAFDAMELTDGSVRILHINRAWEARLGYSRDEVVGRQPTFLRAEMGIIHDSAFFRYAEEAASRDERWSGVIMSRARDGRRVVQECTVASFPDTGAKLSGNLAVRHDIGAREARERALARMQLEFRAVLTELPQPIAVLRGDDVYFGNPALFALLGRSPDDVLARPFKDFVLPDDAHLVQAPPTAQVRTVHIHRPDGSVRIADLSGAGDVSFEGEVSRIVLARDSTDERVTGEREAHASRLAALGALSASVAHEINNPLAYVLANLEALALSGAGHGEEIAEAVEGARRIQRILAELRAFSRLGDEGDELEPVDVERAVTVAINLAANRLRHTTEIERGHQPGLRARARETQLVQVLVNLLVNAAEALEAVPTAERVLEIRSQASETGDRVEISVLDSGPGIGEEALARIFEPFFTTRSRSGGTGLGLSVSRRIVEGFGGAIRVTSPPGKGAMFVISLERAPTLLETAGTMPPLNPVTPKSRSRILVIDDEPAVGRALARLMREHEVEVAVNASEALAKLRSAAPPDLVLCDLMMPGMTGPELFEAVRAEAPELSRRFVFLTGGTFTDAATDFVDAHRDRLISKPFSREDVRAALAQVAKEL